MLMFFITTGIAHEALAMDNSHRNVARELNAQALYKKITEIQKKITEIQIKQRMIELDAPELDASYFSVEAQASYNNVLKILERDQAGFNEIELIVQFHT